MYYSPDFPSYLISQTLAHCNNTRFGWVEVVAGGFLSRFVHYFSQTCYKYMHFMNFQIISILTLPEENTDDERNFQIKPHYS